MNKKAYLIGNNIYKSYSPELYTSLMNVDYQVKNIKTEKELDDLFAKRDFLFVNVTSPYKEKVLDYLDYKSRIVDETHVCNLVVNRNGILKGYNTDAYGFESMLTCQNIEISNKTVLILGNGATSKTVSYVLRKKGAKKVYVACRKKKNESEYLFKDAPRDDVELIVNTTPCGRYEKDAKLVHISNYPKLIAFIDLIYSVYKTATMVDAKEAGKGAVGGLDMLIFQAQQALALATHKLIPFLFWWRLKNEILLKNTNIVLIGLPTSGKSKACRTLKRKFNTKDIRGYFDTDELIEKYTKHTIRQIFITKGEKEFRELERKAVNSLYKLRGVLISTGGGLVLNYENYQKLSRNGFFVYLKKTNFDDFVDNGKRPLVHSKEDLIKLYKARNPVYERRADLTVSSDVDANTLLEEACNAIVSF